MRRTALAIICLISIVATAAPVVGAPKKCPKFTPVEPQTISAQRTEALEAEVVVVTEEATADAPITIDYTHGPGVDDRGAPQPVLEDEVYFNIQIVTKVPTAALTIQAEWPVPVNDIDLALFDSAGFEVMASNAFNPAPTNSDDGLDGPGIEKIAAWPVRRCDGYTIESRGSISAGGPATMTFYLE